VQPLPIDPLLPEIVSHLRSGTRLVLQAAPGAGKTTRVPAALLDAGIAGDKQVVVLEPRRIAARAAADFVAGARAGVVGGEVGYRVRFEQRGGPSTRLWFQTEGLLGRQLVGDPFLEHVGVVVLDEFHERHLQGDVALAVVRELQESVRPDLRLVVMSATIETAPIAAYLGNCPVVTAPGRAFPVQIAYASADPKRPLAGRVATALAHVLDAADDDGGDVLVFLPGAAEIRRAAEAIRPLAALHDWDVVPLHGDLPLDAQQRAIRRGRQRKVILSTNVAETALTVEGVTVVIDSGLARIARLDARHGINVVRVAPISHAAAEQRAGRAGRTRPGRCVRLWTRADHDGRRPYETPEIARLDLSATVLELRAWGLRDVQRFAWLDAPPAAALQSAERLLVRLDAVDGRTGALTDTGQRMLKTGVAPRLARILVEAHQRGCAGAGALVAALASERDILLEQRALNSGPGRAERWPTGLSDLLLRMHLFTEAARSNFDRGICHHLALDHRTVRTVERTRRHLERALARPAKPHQQQRALPDAADTALLRSIFAGFSDRLVRRRAPNSARGVMVGGAGVVLVESSIVRDAELFVAIDLDAGPRQQRSEARVRIASAVRREWLADVFPDSLHQQDEVVFDSERERVLQRTRELFEDLVLSETLSPPADVARASAVLADAARLVPRHAARVGRAEEALLARVRFLQQWLPDLELPTDTEVWLAEAVARACIGKVSFDEVRRTNLLTVLHQMLSGPQRQALDREAPEAYELPTGRRVPVTYDSDRAPVAAARMQELFGLRSTPRLARGRVALAIEVLGPNYRAVQITDDLAGFWARTYPEVRKQLRGRYPKHPWPEDPLSATPTARTGRAAQVAATTNPTPQAKRPKA
jgi:ATP-dependent RNA helicase HrpB